MSRQFTLARQALDLGCMILRQLAMSVFYPFRTTNKSNVKKD